MSKAFDHIDRPVKSDTGATCSELPCLYKYHSSLLMEEIVYNGEKDIICNICFTKLQKESTKSSLFPNELGTTKISRKVIICPVLRFACSGVLVESGPDI